ncbi:MAG: HAD family phosphatase [Patescibacteria group bacterium]|nr:HAD family phosphatase [Patescibacteria group bacterium]
MQFKAVGFDYSGVLAGISGTEFEIKASNVLGVEPQSFRDVYFEFSHLINNGTVSSEEFWQKVTNRLNTGDRYHALINFIEGLPAAELNKQVLNIVTNLKNKGYKIGLLSNNTAAVAEELRKNVLLSNFDAIVASGEIGISKPHPNAFKILAERLEVKPKETIFIDDTERNLAAAKEMGFHTILFTNCEQLSNTLKSIGVL